MVTRKRKSSPARSLRSEAALRALEALILKHDGQSMAPTGTAQLAVEYADALVSELNNRRSLAK